MSAQMPFTWICSEKRQFNEMEIKRKMCRILFKPPLTQNQYVSVKYWDIINKIAFQVKKIKKRRAEKSRYGKEKKKIVLAACVYRTHTYWHRLTTFTPLLLWSRCCDSLFSSTNVIDFEWQTENDWFSFFLHLYSEEKQTQTNAQVLLCLFYVPFILCSTTFAIFCVLFSTWKFTNRSVRKSFSVHWFIFVLLFSILFTKLTLKNCFDSCCEWMHVIWFKSLFRAREKVLQIKIYFQTNEKRNVWCFHWFEWLDERDPHFILHFFLYFFGVNLLLRQIQYEARIQTRIFVFVISFRCTPANISYGENETKNFLFPRCELFTHKNRWKTGRQRCKQFELRLEMMHI